MRSLESLGRQNNLKDSKSEKRRSKRFIKRCSD
jgi:hypothetical protein